MQLQDAESPEHLVSPLPVQGGVFKRPSPFSFLCCQLSVVIMKQTW